MTVASRLAVHVGGPVQQLGGGELLRDQPQKRQLDVARAQHGAGRGVLEARRRLVERVVGRDERSGLALQILVGRLADPLGAG